VPHLRDGFIVAKVGYFRGSENPDTLNSPMPSGLIRLQREGDDHFITFSCYRLWLKAGKDLRIDLDDAFSVHLLKSTQALDVFRRGRSPVLAGDVDFDGLDIVPSLGNSTSKTLN
jgi:hypothetical protein